jgi:hypothetical protein
MDFQQLQRSWQQQAAPFVPVANTPATTPGLLAETQRLHRLGRRSNGLASILIGLAYVLLIGPAALQYHSLVPLQAIGLGLLTLTLLGYVALMWWGTALRRAARPDLNSQAYLQASLRAFCFRRTTLLWLAVPYALGLGVGLWLLNAHRLTYAPLWQPVLAFFLLLSSALWGRRVALRRYERQFGETERQLLHWQQALELKS